jgi:hypothetical protein
VTASQTPGAAPDLMVRVSHNLFVREVNRRAVPELARFNLRDPRWELGADNTVTLHATGKLPIIGTDVGVRVVTRPVVRGGSLAVELLSVSSGRLQMPAARLSGFLEDLNRQIASAIDRRKFEVEDVRTSPEAIVLRLRVVGEL